MNRRAKKGLLAGRFSPLHEGHLFVCRTALQLCDELTILVAGPGGGDGTGSERPGQMKQLFPKARILYDGEQRADFGMIEPEHIKRLHPEPIDLIFGSNANVHRLAKALGAQSVVLDPDKEAVTGAWTTARAGTFDYREHLERSKAAAPVRRVCVTGPESTGKTTLAKNLAAQYATLYVPEYGRIYDEQYRPENWTPAQLVTIAETHRAMRRALEPLADRLLVEDTDALLTTVWSEALAGSVDPWFDQDFELADLYLLTDIDVPWVGDGLRLFGKEEERRAFFEKARAVLETRGANYIVLSGDWDERRARAIEAVSALVSEET